MNTPLNSRQCPATQTDDDTPHLYRSKEAIQKSYAARHLASMREGSDSVDNTSLEATDQDHNVTPDSEPSATMSWLSERVLEESEYSIELHRNVQLSPTASLHISHPKMYLPLSPEEKECDSFTQKKRRYECVERSPLLHRTAQNKSTGLTMEFQNIHMQGEKPAKRCNMDLDASPVHPVRGFHDSLTTRTPEHLKVVQPETPCTPPHPPAPPFIHMSSSPVIQRPEASSNCPGFDQGDSTNLPSTTLVASPITKIPDTTPGGKSSLPSSPGNNLESSLGSELEDISGVFHPMAGSSTSHVTESDHVTTDVSAQERESSLHSECAEVSDVSMQHDSIPSSASHAEAPSDVSTGDDSMETIPTPRNNMADRVADSLASQDEGVRCKSPATSTPTLNNSAAKEIPENNSAKFPDKKPVNKLIKKVSETVCSGCVPPPPHATRLAAHQSVGHLRELRLKRPPKLSALPSPAPR